MSYQLDDTICAVATAPGGAARGMVRVSGPDAVAIVSRLFEAATGLPLHDVRQPTALVGHVRVELDGFYESTNPALAPPYKGAELSSLPCDLFLWPTARSYTREPVAELHTIGSSPLLEALLAAVCRAGARLAEPGEFTLRAFLAGRLDLTQAEAVLGVIDARGDAELSGALAQLAGGLARPLHQLREDLLQLLAELEAGLDFVDEDIEFVSADEVRERLDSAGFVLSEIAQQVAARHTTGQAMQIALTGAPNAGKSSLFNALVARRGVADKADRRPCPPALVSPQRGTTRDYLTATIELDGLRCDLIDTAGIHAGGPDGVATSPSMHDRQLSAIDSAAQALAIERREHAAIRAQCIDASQIAAPGLVDAANCDVIVLTKADIVPPASRIATDLPANIPVILTSSFTGEGLAELCAEFRHRLSNERAAEHGQVVAATADRCRESIRLAEAALSRARKIVITKGGDELLAAELRTALSELGKVVGAVYTDDLLDRIFSTFCIGK
jgi:tRNA modification GTPase